MAFANASYTDIVATTLESRSKKIADNVTKNNALYSRMEQKGNIRTVSGGSTILEELSFAENGNFGWYSGYDLLPVAAQDVISAASYSWKQCAVPVVVSGLEQLQNSGSERTIDLLEGRIRVAEATMANRMSEGVYSDGTGYGGKQLVGLLSLVSATPTTGTYGGISRDTWTFWRNQYATCTSLSGGAASATNLPIAMNAMWANLVRGKNRTDLILADNTMWKYFVNALQLIQRVTTEKSASLGFPSVDFMGADVVLDGGIGGYMPSGIMYFLNTDFLFLRPHKDRNMVPLSPTRRVAINQDAEVEILAWAGALTCSGAQFQGAITSA